MSSVGFRHRLQQQVARAVNPVQIASLLPWSSIARGLCAAIVGVGIAVALSWVPGLHWPHRVARALLPGANLGRISRFEIEILNPSPASTTLPGGAVAAIDARVRGPLPNDVVLETRIAGEADSQSMRGVTRSLSAPIRTSANGGVDKGGPTATAVELRSDDLVYTANLTIGDAEIEYRVLADDAHTPWYRLQTRPRPEVVSFDMRIEPPAYSQQPAKVVSSSTGDIEALRGSRVQLQLLCNQAIRSGWLSVSLPEAAEPKKIELTPVPVTESFGKPEEGKALEGRRFAAELVVDGDYTYRVHLEAADTGFTNAFSSEYHVRGLVDDPPRLNWVNVTSNMMVVEPNQLIPLQIEVEDELPIAEALLITSTNGEEPIVLQFDLPKEVTEGASGATANKIASRSVSDDSNAASTRDFKVTLATELDLLKLKARIGDTLRIAAQATDRAGQTTVSTAIELVVSSTGVDPQRRPATEQRIDLAAELRKFSEQIQPQVKQIREMHEEINKLPLESDSRAGKIEELKAISKTLSQATAENAKTLREKTLEYLKLSQDSVSLSELERVGQVLARAEMQLSNELDESAQLLDTSTNSASDEKAQSQQRDQLGKLRAASEKIGDAASVLDRRFREFVSNDILSEIARGLSVVQDFQKQLNISAETETPAQLKRRQAVVARQLRELEQIMVDRSSLLREHATNGLRGWIEWSGQMAERIERATNDTDDNPNFKEFTKQVLNEVGQHQNIMAIDGGLESEINNGRRELDARSDAANATLGELAKATAEAAKGESAALTPELRETFARGLTLLQQRKELEQARGDNDAHHVSDMGNAIRATRNLIDTSKEQLTNADAEKIGKTAAALKKLEAIHNVNEANKHLANIEQIERWNSSSIEARTESPRAWDAFKQRVEQSARALREAGIDNKLADQVDHVRYDAPANEAGQKIQSRRWSNDAQVSAEGELAEMRKQMDAARAQLDTIARAARMDLMEAAPSVPELARKAAKETNELQQETEKLAKAAAAEEVPDIKARMDELNGEQQRANEPINDLRDALTEMAAVQDLLDDSQRAIARDADTSQQIIEQASQQVSESLKPAAEAATPAAAAKPLQKAAEAQSEATAALEQIADHFEKLQRGDLPEVDLADSRKALKQMASDMDMAAMDEWYKTAESLGKLAGGDPKETLEKLENELNRNARMREELSDISKQALDASVKALAHAADQERSLQSQIEQSDPVYSARKQLLQQDIQAANERMHQWMQQLTGDASSVAGRANAKPQQQKLTELQQQLQQTIADASTAHVNMPMEDMQRLAETVVKSLESAKQDFDSVAQAIKPTTEEAVHANEQDLKSRKREMEDWERRMVQQQARAAQAVERSHEQRVRQADNATRNAESLKRNAERSRDEVAKQSQEKPEDAGLKQRVIEAERQVKRMEREQQVAEQREAALKDRLAQAKQTQQEMTARKPSELGSKNPTAELATRLATNAAETSTIISDQLKKSLADTGWKGELAATQNQLQWGKQQQDRVEQNVEGVANNLDRAARHEQRLDRPKAAERIGKQAEEVKHAKEEEVHTAAEQLASAAEQAAKSAADNAASNEVKDTAPPAASLAARGAVSAAETELRSRVNDLNNMLAKPQQEDSAGDKDRSIDAPAEPSVPLDPKMLAQMLDELDRQMSGQGENESSESQDSQDSKESQSDQQGEAQQSESKSGKSGSKQAPGKGKQKQGSKTSTMQQASQQLSEQMNRQRAQNRQASASSRMTGDTADTKPQAPSAVRVLSVDRRNGEDWGKLREQAAEQTIESARQSIAPQYRNSVETYFRVLSERGALDRGKK